MADYPSWHISGDFYANCSCANLQCPCAVKNFTVPPTRGWCKLAMAMIVSEGTFGDLDMSGAAAVLVAHCPSAMADGGWSIGLIFDDRMSPQQAEALGGILGGQLGGPMVDYAPWASNFLGAENRRIEFKKDGLKRSIYIEGMVDNAAEGILGPDGETPVVWDNVFHPANTRIALAEGVKTSIHAFGIDFEIADGEKSFSAFTTFSWRVDA